MKLFFQDLIWLYSNKITAFIYPITIIWISETILGLNFVPEVIANYTLILFCYSIIECGSGLSGVKLILNRLRRNEKPVKIISGLLLLQAMVASFVILLVWIFTTQESPYVLTTIIISLTCYIFVPEWIYVAYNRNYQLAKILLLCRIIGLSIFASVGSHELDEAALLLILNLPIILSAFYHVIAYRSNRLQFYKKSILKRLINISLILFYGRIFTVLYTTAPVMIITRLVSEDFVVLYYALDRLKALVSFISTPIATKVWPYLSNSYSKSNHINSFFEITNKIFRNSNKLIIYAVLTSLTIYTVLAVTDNHLIVGYVANYIIILLITSLPLVIIGSSIYGNYILIGSGKYRVWLFCLHCVTIINVASFFYIFSFHSSNFFLVALVFYVLPEMYVFMVFFMASWYVARRSMNEKGMK